MTPDEPDTLFDLPQTTGAANDELTQSQAEVWEVLRDCGPATDAALVSVYQAHASVPGGGVLPQSPSGIRSRRAELVEKGRVVDTGNKVRLVSGRWATEWKAVRR